MGFVVVGSGVSMGPLSADTQPPPSSADSAWFAFDTQLGFCRTRTDDGETGLPPLNPPGSSNRKPQRNSDLDFRLFAVSIRKYINIEMAISTESEGGIELWDFDRISENRKQPTP